MTNKTRTRLLAVLAAIFMITSPMAGVAGASVVDDAGTSHAPESSQQLEPPASGGNADRVSQTESQQRASQPVGEQAAIQTGGAVAEIQPPGFDTETVLSGLNQPTATTFLPDGRMLLLQKGGEVLIVNPETGATSTYMTITDLDTAGEEGLIDLTLDPNFQQNNYVYLYYTPESSGKNRIARFTHQENGGGLQSTADPSSEFVVWEDNSERKSNYHHGGGLDFGPDGKLYLTIGEEVDGNQAQDLTEAGGSVIRVNKDGTIPQDNPFVDGSGGNVDAIWAYGLRNPFRAEWDLQAENPRYYIAEVGGNQQSVAQEDLHIGEKGANYGWPNCEGECSNSEYTDALYTYPHEGSGASITGGVVYHGNQFPSEYEGAYFFADYVRGWMKYLTFDSSGEVQSVNTFDDNVGPVVEIDQGPDGSLYYLDIGSGTLQKVTYDDTTDAEPTLDAPANVFVDADGSKQIDITASDADGDPLTLTVENLPGFASFTDDGDGTATLSLSPSSADTGQYQTTVTVSDGDDTTSQTVTISVIEPGAEQILYRLNGGDSSVQAVDDGPNWESDSLYEQGSVDQSDWSGTTYSVGQAVPATTPDAIFESERWPADDNTLEYDLPVSSGDTYEVRLYFIEQYSSAQNPGDRVMDVSMEGQTVLNDYDVVADVGYKNATMKSFEVTADDGTLDLSIAQDGGSNNALVYGIEVLKPSDDTSNQPPSASFTASPSDPTTGESVTFDAFGSSDSDGSIQSYEWDFDGDGTTDAMGESVSQAFTSSGDQTVELTVTDDDGATATTTQTVSVSSTQQGQQVLYRVSAGGPEIQVQDGPDWESDTGTSPSQYRVGGGDGTTDWNSFTPNPPLQYDVGSAVPAGTPDAVFEYERYANDGSVDWEFPVTQGETYEVRLYHIEQYSEANGAGERVMDVSMEGQTVLNDYDVVADVGYKNATMESFEVTADDDTLDISVAQDGGEHNPNVFGVEVVQPGTDGANQAPEATIDAPADGSFFQAGDTIDFSGSATDPEDGSLSGTDLEWTVRFLHNEHWHPYLDSVSGSSGSFTAPTSGHDFHDDTAYQINLTATDSEGATDTATVVVEPDKVNLTFDTQPSGLEIDLDSIPHTTPYVHDSLIGFEHTVSAPQTQCMDGTEYQFEGWSDGGATQHTITVPDSDTTYTANYTAVGPCDGADSTVAQAVASQNAPTDQIGLQEIQLAINWWSTSADVPNTGGETISLQQIQQLINAWSTGATVGDGNQSPSAAFTASPSDPATGEQVSFDASGSTDSDGSIASYEWNFGDGTTASGASPSHTYESAGTYTVTLTVTDDDGATATATQQVTVSAPQTQQVVYRLNAGDSSITAVDDGPDWENDTEYLQAAGQQSTPETWGANYSIGEEVPDSTPDAIFESERWTEAGPIDYDIPVTAGETYEVRLYFIEQYDPAQTPGDRVFDVTMEGQTVLNDYDTVAEVGYKNATMETIEVTPQDGTLDLTFTQDGGSEKPFVYGIEILTEDGQQANQPPTAGFHVHDPVAGQSATYHSESTDSDGQIASYEWDFDGDGTFEESTTNAQIQHTFDSGGDYDVTLKVTDDDGATDTATKTVTVASQPSEQVVYRVNAGGPELQATDGGPNWAVDNATDGSQSPYLVGDGDVTVHDTQFTVTDSVPQSTRDQIFVTERYVDQQMSWDFPATQGETYEVRLYYVEQWDPNAQEGARIFDVAAEGQTVQNDYDVMADVGFDNATMKSFTVTADDGTLDIDFSQDGGGAYPLIYGIEIIQQGEGGNLPPTASLSTSTTSGTTGQSISFEASGSNDPDGSIASYEWDFDGDGVTDATGPSVSHTFQSAGTYTVELAVTDDGGATATATEQISVTDPSAGTFTTEQMAGGLDQPVAMEVLPDDRILIVERGGDVLIAEEQGNSLSTSEYLSLSSVSTNGEQGLLGVTIDPNFESNGYVYLYYTNENTDTNQISRFVHQENGGGLQSTADPTTETKIWNSSIQGDATYHHGGGLDFGPDGKLYLSTGEQFTASRAQDLSSTGGKIIRINKDGSIPSDNPYVNDGDPNTRGDVWASGLRNPFRAEWDHQTNRFFVAEVGLDTAEDIHLGKAGANYGWPDCEGECSDPAYDDPVYTYGHDVGESITGGDFYRGSQFPSEYEGAYFYGDYVSGWIKYLTFDSDGDVTGSHDFKSDANNVVEIDQGPDGSLYYIDISGSVHRVSFQPAEEGSATVSLNEGNSNIDTSTWKSGAVEIENTGDKQIESVTFDLSTAAMPDVVFGPLTDSGTPGNAVKDASGAGAFQTSYSQPHEGNPDDGYDQLTFTYDDFQPGETFTVSLDTDALSVKGATPIQQGLEISGLETTGATVTIEYADGTTQTTSPFSDGSAAGAVATAKSDVPAAPNLDVQGVTLDGGALDARHSAATVSSAQQTVEISGEPGSTVRVLRFEGELNLEGVSGYDLEPYEANRILNFDEQTITLDNNGEATVDVTLTNGSAAGGLNYIVAVTEDAQGDTGLTSDPIVLDYDPGAAQPSGGEATVAITTTEAAFPEGKVTLQDATTYFEDSVQITNTGDQQIESLTIDKSTSLIENMVYDPTGCAGDGGCNPGATDIRIVNEDGAVLTSHEFQKPVNGVDGTDGYKALHMEFDDFDPGETITYASDGDPNTIKGGGGQQSVLAGPESGIDLTGTTVTASFADGTTASSGTFNEGSLAGSTGVARANAPDAPSIDAQDVTLQATTLSDRHTAATVADADQTIEISGPPGETVRLMHAEATLLLEDVPTYDGTPGYDIEPYEANNVENYTITDVQLDQNGEATVDATLTNLTGELTSPADESGFNYFVATVQGDDGHAGTASNVIVLKLEEGSQTPSIQSVDDQFLTEGDSTTVTVEATDPNGDALTLSASNLPGFASFTDNGDGTGTLTASPQTDDAGDYDITLSASDGEYTTTQQVSISVAEPGGDQVVHRLHAGSGTISAIDGGPDWGSDSQYMTTAGDTSDWSGTTYTVGPSVPASTPDAVFETERYPTSGSTIDYDLPVTQGETYEVRLYFIEQYSDTQDPGDRVFDVTIDGQTVLNDYDVVADVGFKNATVKSFEVTADDGTLDLSFSQASGASPFMYGVEVVKPGASNQAPNASVTASATNVETGQTIDFDASGSNDSDGSIASYEWDFDDGTTATGPTPSHSYDSAGTYTVELTVTDDDGATDTATTTVTVAEPTTSSILYRLNAGGPEITATDGGPDWMADNDSATSQYLVDDNNVGTTNWLTFQDGPLNYEVGAAVPASTPDAVFEYERYATDDDLAYSFPATQGEAYEVRLYYIEQYDSADGSADRVMDVTVEGQTVLSGYDTSSEVGFKNGTMESAEVTADDGTLDLTITDVSDDNSANLFAIEVLEATGGAANQAPNASVTASATDVETGQSIDFDASGSNDPDGSIASYEWDFDGDGTTDATGAQASHAFQSAGTYQVNLTVTDDDGAIASTQQTVSVSEPTSSNVVYRVNTAGSEISVSDEPNWETDSSYLLTNGGVTTHDNQFNVTDSVPAGTPEQIFVTERWPSSGSTLDYEFSVTSGETYEIRLYFIEQWSPNDEEGTRIFDVTAEGQTVLNDYDIMTDVGFDNATTKSFEVTADDGTLDISLSKDGGSANPFVYGIEIVEKGS
ncbi:malectin domain-containing carbohydrate-binding protein [Halobellus litoreus]|uniref:Malectin domain-containing carbohydrate-binding protein n=1 Tax=Halobellus litoreus TaxID=755310 RepID=A0ABD6DXW0_9EURY|nr:malectin domain-containing carbohydrate-binding protein [Halobellus litoreus]